MPDQQAALTAALAEACRFAAWHGVEGTVRPEDFAVQHRPPGIHAVYVNADVAVIVTLDGGNGNTTFGLADLDWLHYPDTANGTEPCVDECASRRPQAVAYLPGDAPAEVSADA